MKAMMLTAGLGTRLRPVTDHFAKPAVPFLNIPLFYYPISLMEELEISSLVLNTHYKPEQIARLAERIPGANYPVALSNEPEAPLGSGGGVWKARRLLEGNGEFLVCNGDEVILPHDPRAMRRFLEEHRRHRPLASILVMEHPGVGRQFGGVWADDQGNVRGFAKSRDVFPELHGYHYIGLLLLDERVFSYLPAGESNILYDALAAGIARGESVRAVVDKFTWYETGNPGNYLSATGEALKLFDRPDSPDARALRHICDRFWPKGTRLERRDDSTVLIGAGAVIDPSARLKGFVVLGDGARIEGTGHIENVVVMPGVALRGDCADQIVCSSQRS